MTTAAGRLLTAQHYAAQVALRAQAVRDAHRLWQHWTPGDAASWRRMVELAKPVLDARHAQSSALAARYFTQMAAVETGSNERAVLGERLPDGQIDRSLAQTGLVGTIAAKARGLALPAAAAVGFVRFSGAFSKMSLEGGRGTVLASVAASPRATRYQRVTSGEPCEFCADLSGQASASDAFPAHDHCSCAAEPVFGA